MFISFVSRKIILNYIFFISAILYVEGKINIEENKSINILKINEVLLKDITKPGIKYNKIISYKANEKCNIMNNIDINNNRLPLKDNESLQLKIGYNLINNSYSSFYLNISDIPNGKDLLLFTNLVNNITYCNQSIREGDVTAFDLYTNEEIINNTKNNSQTLKFKLNKNDTHGFLDFKLVNQDEFEINKNTPRELVYKNYCKKLIKDKTKAKYLINLIPSDNNSDIYYLQYNFSVPKKKVEKKIELYYFNEIKIDNNTNDTIDEILENVLKKRMRRDRKINGKIEIFSFRYKNLLKDVNLTLSYTRIKGEGTLGFILTLSILSVLLLIALGLFVKNTYYGNVKSSYDDLVVN